MKVGRSLCCCGGCGDHEERVELMFICNASQQLHLCKMKVLSMENPKIKHVKPNWTVLYHLNRCRVKPHSTPSFTLTFPFPLKPRVKPKLLWFSVSSRCFRIFSFSRFRLRGTLPAVPVSSIRPKANYPSGTPHSCSLLPPLPRRRLWPPSSLHVSNQSVYLSTGCTSGSAA